MVTQVTLGNFYTNSSGKLVMGGAGGSGLDTQSLISTLVAAKSTQLTQDQAEIKTNDAQSAALNQFQQLLSTFESASDALSNPPGVDNAANNVFDFTTASVSSNGSEYLTATAAPGAAIQTYTVNNITQLATAASESTGVLTASSADDGSITVDPADATANKFTAGTLTFTNINTPTETQTITIDTGDSLNAIAAKFNAVSANTGISASVVQVSSGSYQMLFRATNTGSNGTVNMNATTDLTSTSIDPDNTVLGNVVSSSSFQVGKDANFMLNNLEITRSSNNINDVISGVTFNLLQTTSTDQNSNSNISVTVAPDTTDTQNAIVTWVNAYNAIKTFEAQQTQLNSDGTYASTAILANNEPFRDIMTDINTQIGAQVEGISPDDPQSLNDVGITFTNQAATSTAPEVDNILTVNDGTLSSALSTNFQGVSNLFGFNLTSDSTDLAVYSHTNALSASNFTLNIDPGSNTFTATVGTTTVNLTAQALTGGVAGYTLTGPAGSALDGLVLIYASDSPATVHVTATQGVADKQYSTLNAALTANTGTLAVELTSLQGSDTKLNNDITQQNTFINQYQDQLTQQFAALEQAISNTNSLLDALSANDAARLEASSIS